MGCDRKEGRCDRKELEGRCDRKEERNSASKFPHLNPPEDSAIVQAVVRSEGWSVWGRPGCLKWRSYHGRALPRALPRAQPGLICGLSGQKCFVAKFLEGGDGEDGGGTLPEPGGENVAGLETGRSVKRDVRWRDSWVRATAVT